MADNKLRRQDGVIAGVCGGLGAYLGINPLWIRILFLIALIPGGVPGLLVYALLWLVMPRKQSYA